MQKPSILLCRFSRNVLLLSVCLKHWLETFLAPLSEKKSAENKAVLRVFSTLIDDSSFKQSRAVKS